MHFTASPDVTYAHCDFHHEFFKSTTYGRSGFLSDTRRLRATCRRDCCPSAWLDEDDAALPACAFRKENYCRHEHLREIANAVVEFTPATVAADGTVQVRAELRTLEKARNGIPFRRRPLD